MTEDIMGGTSLGIDLDKNIEKRDSIDKLVGRLVKRDPQTNWVDCKTAVKAFREFVSSSR